MCWLVWTSKDLGGDRPDSRAIWKPCTGETRCYRFPAEMTWLWRDYDPAKTSQTYEMEVSEKAKPLFRVTITSREAH